MKIRKLIVSAFGPYAKEQELDFEKYLRPATLFGNKFENLIEELTLANVKIWSVKENGCINNQDIDKLMNSFRMYMNEQFSKDTSIRIKSQKQMAREQGLFLGGRVSFGFKVVNKRLVVDETKVEIVDEVSSAKEEIVASVDATKLDVNTNINNSREAVAAAMESAKVEIVDSLTSTKSAIEAAIAAAQARETITI